MIALRRRSRSYTPDRATGRAHRSRVVRPARRVQQLREDARPRTTTATAAGHRRHRRDHEPRRCPAASRRPSRSPALHRGRRPGRAHDHGRPDGVPHRRARERRVPARRTRRDQQGAAERLLHRRIRTKDHVVLQLAADRRRASSCNVGGTDAQPSRSRSRSRAARRATRRSRRPAVRGSPSSAASSTSVVETVRPLTGAYSVTVNAIAVRDVARRRADAQLELAGLDGPVVRRRRPRTRTRAGRARASTSPRLARVEPHLGERLQLLLRPRDRRLDVVHVALHDLGAARAARCCGPARRREPSPSRSSAASPSPPTCGASSANVVYESPCPKQNRGSMRARVVPAVADEHAFAVAHLRRARRDSS